MTVSIWQVTAQTPPRHLQTDVVIVGAGLLGCTAAYYLRQLGLSAVILEAQDVGLGASSRNAGFMLSGLDTYYHQAEEKYGPAAAKEIWSLSKQTLAFWRGHAQAEGVFLEQCGSMLLAESPEESQDLAQAARRMEAAGFDCEYLSTDPLGRGYYGAIRQPGDGGLQPYDLVQALYRLSGAELINNSEVYHIESEPGGVRVASRRALVRARYALLCTNAYSIHLDPYFIGKIIPNRAQCLATAPLPDRLLNTVGYSDYGYMYYRDLPGGGLLIGGGRKAYRPQETDTTDDRITPWVQGALEDYLRTRFPEVTAPIVRRWAGIMGFTPDGLPMVGSLPRDKRMGFAVGLNGHGLSLGAKVAERAVEWLINGKHPGILAAERLH
jgi:glycine/D-amino acid oxidase-like deaminating enzyme